MKIRKILIASAVMLSAFQLSGSKAFSQDLSALDCKVLSDEDSSREDYLKKFRKSYLETRSLAQMSSMVNFFDIAVNDCNAIIIVSLTPKENMGGEKEAWIFQREPWALIGSN
jgi:hypothetical protein